MIVDCNLFGVIHRSVTGFDIVAVKYLAEEEELPTSSHVSAPS